MTTPEQPDPDIIPGTSRPIPVDPDTQPVPDPEPETALQHVFAEDRSGFEPLRLGAQEAPDDGGDSQRVEGKADEKLDTTGGEATPSEPPAGGSEQP